MAANGPRSARVAAEIADELVTSVKDAAATEEHVIAPYRHSRAERGDAGVVMATRRCILAANEDEAWEAVRPLRGLRVPGRSDVGDPAVLRRRADDTGRDAVLARYPIARSVDDLVALFRPLVDDLRADYVSVQIASTDAERAIGVVGRTLLPTLRS
jgi:coenzyme F420-dependent glucose-6-phosphate dehydrogenase